MKISFEAELTKATRTTPSPRTRAQRRRSFSARRDRIDLVGVESEPLLDRAHLVVRRLIGPDRILRAVLQGVVRRGALEGADGLVLRADEPLHLHVFARDVVDGGIVALPELDRVPGVGDDLALDLHLHARWLRRDAMVRIFLPPGAAVSAHGILLSVSRLSLVSRPAQTVPKRSTSIPKASHDVR